MIVTREMLLRNVLLYQMCTKLWIVCIKDTFSLSFVLYAHYPQSYPRLSTLVKLPFFLIKSEELQLV